MWIASTAGFFSIVRHTGDRDLVLVRARRHGHLEALRKVFPSLPATISTPERDYPYRVELPHDQLADLLAALADRVTYPNFKAAVKGAREHSCYAKVWGVVREFLDPRVNRRGLL